MANENIKKLNTRVALKYDSYSAWINTDEAGKGGNLVLLPGEIGLCEIPSTTTTVKEPVTDSNGVTTYVDRVVTTPPTVLFKVGSNDKKAFKDLPWASAKAADVYDWAKAKTVSFNAETKQLEFKDASNNVISAASVDLSAVAAAADLVELASRVDSLEDLFEEGGNIAESIDSINESLETLNGTAEEEGSIANIATGIANAALESAKTYTDGAIEDVEETIAEVAGNLETLGSTVDGIDDAYKAADASLTEAIQAINDKIGGSFTNNETVATAIATAQQAAEEAAGAVNTLKTTEVAANTKAIEENAATIEQTAKDLAQEVTDRTNADKALSDRLAPLEAFFGEADKDGLHSALDTLVAIQNFITTEGEAADELAEAVSGNTEAIGTINESISDHEQRVGALEQAKTAHDTAIQNAQKAADDAQDAAEAADTKAGNAATAASNAQDTADDALEIANTANGLAADNASRLDAVEGDIEDLTGRVEDLEAEVIGDNSNTKLREAITSLQELTGASNTTSGNSALATKLGELSGKVDDPTTGLAATHGIATANAGRLDKIEADYLKEADELILNCGSATEVIHSKQ